MPNRENHIFDHLNAKLVMLLIILSLAVGILAYATYSTDYFLNLNIKSKQAEQIKLYFDKEKSDYNEKNSIPLSILGDGKFHKYSFKIAHGHYGPHRIKVFIGGSEPLTINHADITNARGMQIIEYPISGMSSIMDVMLTYNTPDLIIEKAPDAKDPNILLNSDNISLPLDKQARISFSLKIFGLAFFFMFSLAYIYTNKIITTTTLTKNKRAIDVLFYVILLLFFTSMWLKNVQPFIEDDGAFFLQYAVNMAHGEFWKYNMQDSAPVWGASAPLWPLVIAFFIKVGFSPIVAIHLSSYLCSIFFVLISALVLDKKLGKHAAFLFILLVSLDNRIQHFFSSGLESPLTALLVSLLFATTLEVITSNKIFAVTIGLLAVQKIDLIPVACIGYILHVHYKNFDKTVLAIAVLIPCLWYAFAWRYFGYPLPNSFLTKALHQNHMPMLTKTTWFIDILFTQCRSIITYLLLPGFLICLFYKKYRFFALTFGSLICMHLIAYTFKRPFEPYSWYTIPSIVAYLFIATVGISIIINKIKFRSIATLATIILCSFFLQERLVDYLNSAKYMNETASLVDTDRAKAGQWVNKHTRNNATVYTGWGLSGYYANRYVYDFSFLNRIYETTSLVLKYRPDVFIHQGYISGSKEVAQCDNPDLFKAYNDYHIVKTFTSYFDKTGENYCFFVAVRDKKVLV